MRGRVVIGVAAAAVLILVPTGSALTTKPLAFSRVATGTARADPLARQHLDRSAFTHRTVLDADAMVSMFEMGDGTRAALDRVDFRKHVVVMLFARRSLVPTRVTVGPLPFRYAHTELCVDVRSRGEPLTLDYAYTVVAVKKPKGLDQLLAFHEGIPVVVRERGKLLTPNPPGVTRPARCP